MSKIKDCALPAYSLICWIEGQVSSNSW